MENHFEPIKNQELSQEQFLAKTKIEMAVIGRYAPRLKEECECPLAAQEARLEWIKKYGKKFHIFFEQNQQELIDSFKSDPDKTIDRIESHLGSEI